MTKNKNYSTKSMTAFARHQGEAPGATFTWELKSVNHRYLENSFKLPESFRYLEIQLRDKLRSRLARGKVDVHLQFERAQAEAELAVNSARVAELMQAVASINEQCGLNAKPTAWQILQSNGVLQQQEFGTEEVEQSLLQHFDLAVAELIKARQAEGEKLAALIGERLGEIGQLADRVEQLIPEIVSTQREKLQTRMAELQLDIEPERLAQEAAIYAQKVDVAEEVDRLRAHIAEVEKTLCSGEPCGRRLDFLMQELNREANTLGSKSVHVDTSQGAVDLKVYIEQMREQVQNIE